MCTQTVGLVAAECERQGIATTAIQLLWEVAQAVRPPRGLWVPYPHGYPLGKPNDLSLQHAVLARALALFGRKGPGPILERLSGA